MLPRKLKGQESLSRAFYGQALRVEEREPERREPKDQDVNPLTPAGLDSVRFFKAAWCAGGSINTNTEAAKESLPCYRAFLLPKRSLGKKIQF